MNPNSQAISNYPQFILVLVVVVGLAWLLSRRKPATGDEQKSLARPKPAAPNPVVAPPRSKITHSGLFSRLLAFVQPRARARRLRLLNTVVAFKPGLRVIDLGGTTEIWSLVDVPLDITIVNLPGIEVDRSAAGPHRIRFVEGDATALDYPDMSFDLVFSNSVIEHVGGQEAQERFSGEARRLAPNYCIQTPSIWFPLEPHSGVPFWWFLPKAMRQWHHRRLAQRLPAFNDMLLGTTVLRKSAISALFPDAQIVTERVLMIPKSYIACR
jgi:hypothetical protein